VLRRIRSFIPFGQEEEALTIGGDKQRRSSLYKSRRHHNQRRGTLEETSKI